MKLFIEHDFDNWNEYIRLERTNKYIANNLKQKEKRIVKQAMKDKKYTGNYPVEIIFKPHFKDRRRDLDNYRVKGLLDGLVSCGVLENDNLKHIQRIVLEPIFTKEVGIEVEIREMK